MPLSDIIMLTAIVGAFLLFGVVLAWGEYQTRNFKRPGAEPHAEALKQEMKHAA